jgi:uncharacterized protein (DUF2141 family)
MRERKRWGVVLVLLAGVLPAAGQSASSGKGALAENVGTLTVVTSGLKEDRGELLIQLANSRAAYESDENPFRFAAVPVAGRQGTAVFEGLPYGEYAVKVFHDANQNKKLDFGMMGPKESYGFSNNARGLFGPADYDAAKFNLDTATLTITIEAK